MGKRIWTLLALAFLLGLIACNERRDKGTSDDIPDSLSAGVTEADTLSLEEDDLEETESWHHLDGSFDDFVFAFVRSRRLQAERTGAYRQRMAAGGEPAPRIDWRQELDFLMGEYYTILFGSMAQIEEENDTCPDNVLVERINLEEETLKLYNFQRQNGLWTLTDMSQSDFAESDLHDFLRFYARFSADSLFQAESIAQPLRFSMLDPDDEMNYIVGTIDAAQWSSFCPEVPQGIISNIRSGQTYANPLHIVMQKCGAANGLQELFTFDKEGSRWRLTSYEN